MIKETKAVGKCETSTPQNIHESALHVKMFNVVDILSDREVVTVSGMKDSMSVGSSPSERRKIYHTPRSNNYTKTRPS